jgi:hypothetical protein
MKTSLAIVLAAALMVSVTGAAIAHPSKGVYWLGGTITSPKLDLAPTPAGVLPQRGSHM